MSSEVGTPGDAMIQRLLQAARTHLGMEVAFIGELHDGVRTFRYVDQAAGLALIEPGHSDPIAATYCQHVAEGRLPELLVDPAQHPLAAALPVTHQLPVGSHISVPIRGSDGRLYGTFCCFSADVHEQLTEQDLGAVRAMAALAAEHLEGVAVEQRWSDDRRERVLGVVGDPLGMAIVYQPIRDLSDGTVVAVESLSRFPGFPEGPQWFYAEAAHLGIGFELEAHAVGLAVEQLEHIPAPARLNVNVSADTLVDSRFLAQLADVPRDRLVVEITELSVVSDDAELLRVRSRLDELGIRLSIDDVGAGWSGLSRILACEPQQLKLDACVTRGVHRHAGRRALIEGLCSFAVSSGAEVVAEGIETEDERVALIELGVPLGQGYHLGRPQHLGASFGSPSAPIELGDAVSRPST